MKDIIYLDNAASSWPKPDGVSQAVAKAIDNYGANPGRGAHQLSQAASRTISACRQGLADFLEIEDADNLVFTKNASEALNLVILNYLGAGDHAICSHLEHNSVVRPLEAMRARGVTYSILPTDARGNHDLSDLKEELEKHPQTKLLVLSHASNVLGNIFPVREAIELGHQYGVKVLIDGAQTVGYLPISVRELQVDFLAFPGHKGLYGPQGTGALYISPNIDLQPLLYGGTGSNSESAHMPQDRPDRYEAGTMNTPGLAGLAAGLAFVKETGLDKIRDHEQGLVKYLMEKLAEIPAIHTYGPGPEEDRAPVLGINIIGLESNELAYMLDEIYGIAVRGGLHCAPLAHKIAGSLNQGIVRISPGYFNTREDIDKLVEALREIIEEI